MRQISGSSWWLRIVAKSLLCLSFVFGVRMGYSQQSFDLLAREAFLAKEEFKGLYTIKGQEFAIWNGQAYVPVFIKGINLGVSVPGTQPGELAATGEDYRRWFRLIKEAGYNTIRLYTLHFPRFYEELRNFNLENPANPLLVLHGVWLDEEIPGSDLFNMGSAFMGEIRDVVDAVHGNLSVDHRFGKAYGDYDRDISPWVIGYLAGREIFPHEVETTNNNHSEVTNHDGTYFRLSGADPVEVWVIRQLDSLMIYERERYQTVRPTGISSWPTLDPLEHPTEQLLPNSMEDLQTIDLSDVVCTDSAGGFFIGYHAYPYYPDFMLADPHYNIETDSAGPNSYLGYLKELKAHYSNIPLLIAEFGVPSSWGAAHMVSSGMHHGGLSEEASGIYAIRMMDNIRTSQCAGGVQFSLIDEWFKQTWITNLMSDKQYRHYWHNITSPEQNFGILSYTPPPEPLTEVGTYADKPISSVKVHADYTFFRIRMHMRTEHLLGDTLWVALDTYGSDLGESVLPNGVSTGDTLRAEFVLQIPLGRERSDLFVIPTYDVFEIGNTLKVDTVVSVKTDEGTWNPVRWKTNNFYHRTFYIGELEQSSSDDPYHFLNAVTVYNDSLDIRLPWTLINFYAPSVRKALHYVTRWDGDGVVIDQQDTLSEGIALTLLLGEEQYRTQRFSWSPWDHEKIANTPPLERKKESFHYLKRMLPLFNSPPIGLADTFEVMPDIAFDVTRAEGLLRNDYDIDGNALEAILPFGHGTTGGSLHLHPDGSFNYTPDAGFKGDDFFMYYLDDESAYSSLVPVLLRVRWPLGGNGEQLLKRTSIYPNPGHERFCIRISQPFTHASLEVVDLTGRRMDHRKLTGSETWVELGELLPGIYLFYLSVDQMVEPHEVIIM